MLINDKIPRLSDRQSEWLFYISLVILSLFAFLFVGELGYVLFDDSGSYMNIYANMEGIMPIYPLFLHANKLLFGESGYLYPVVVEQAVLASVSVILFISVIKNQFGLRYWEAYVCYALALLPFTTDMPEAMTTHEILTEGIAYAVFYLFAAALMRAVWDRSLKWLGILYFVTLVLALIRSQLQILFGVCGVICIYVIVRRKGNKKNLYLRLTCGLAGCMIIALTGVWCSGRISGRFQQIKVERSKEQETEVQLQEKMQSQENVQEKEKKAVKPTFTTSQYVSLIFSRGMYEADYEDYLLFEEEQVRDLYLELYPYIDKAQCRYSYASPGLWMWKDIVGGIGSVGVKCFYVQNNYYNEKYPELVYSNNYSAVRNKNQLTMGLTLIRAHFGRFLYHTVMMLPQAFICTVFFQIEQIYLLCHLITLFLYLSALALMVWAYKDRKVSDSFGELMCSVLGTNLVMIIVISLVFFGQQRYLVYNFGIFYIAYFLLLMQLWKLYGHNLVGRVWHRIGCRDKNKK